MLGLRFMRIFPNIVVLMMSLESEKSKKKKKKNWSLECVTARKIFNLSISIIYIKEKFP